MPHQQYIADVVGEYDRVTGRLYYDELGLTIMRQQGKTTFVEAKAAHRCSATRRYGRRQLVIYTAQTRGKAREKFLEEFLVDFHESPLFAAHLPKPNLSNGSEAQRFPNGSRMALEASTDKSGHSMTIDEAYLDEAFAHQDFRLEQGFSPAMITRRNRLLAWLSTAGWDGQSPYLQEKVTAGQRAVEEDTGTGLCYFDWSIPEDEDIGDERVWLRYMPAVGLLVPVEAIRAEYRKARDRGRMNDFRRAYGNQWVPKGSPGRWMKIREDAWARQADPGSRVAGGLALGFAVAPGAAGAAVAVAGQRAGGTWHVELTEPPRAGTAWLPGRLAELARRHNPSVTVMNPAGAAGPFEKELQALGFSTRPAPGEWRLHLTGVREYGAACGGFAKNVNEGRLFHLGQQPLTDAAGCAGTRPLGDAWAWSWPSSSGDITALEASTCAYYGALAFRPPPEPGIF